MFLALGAEPSWPFVGHELVLEAVLLSEMGDEFLTKAAVSVYLFKEDERSERGTYQEGWGEEVFDKPELDGMVCVPQYTQNHDGGKTLYQELSLAQ